MTNSVPDLRRAALRARRALPKPVARGASLKACRRLARLPAFRRARRIGLYWPMASEADARWLWRELTPRQHVFLPRVVGDRLGFAAINTPRFRRRRSALGIIEPQTGRLCRATALDLLIMPLAAFDSAGRRIGMGGGFYDRTLAGARVGVFRAPRLIGLAFEVQRVARIAARPWDVALDAVVSEAGVYRPTTCPPALR